MTTDPIPGGGVIRKTLGLSGLTLHAMTLVSPGSFVWLVFPTLLMMSDTSTGAGVFVGVAIALGISFLTILGFAQLVSRYPLAGSRSAFHFLQALAEEYADLPQRGGISLLKWLAAWLAHLFYWIYPGILVGLSIQLLVYVLGDFGIHPTATGQVLMVICLSSLIGFLALRGITGSNSSSILLNAVQTGILAVFCLVLVIYRISASGNVTWAYPNIAAILNPGQGRSLLIQTGLAYFLVSGFQAVAATGIWGGGSKDNFSSRGLIGLLVQNGFSYLLQLAAIMLALQTSDVKSILPSGSGFTLAPIAEMVIRIGDQLLWKNGYAFFITLVGAVLISLIASLLTAFNVAVRVNFAIGVDPEMPGILRLVPTQSATPAVSVYLIAAVTALVGIGSTFGGVSVLPGAMLAANLGALGLHGLILLASLFPSPYHHANMRNEWPALLAGLLNWGLVGCVIVVTIISGGLAGLVIWWTGCLILAVSLVTLIATFSKVK
jgi:amino acid transporter